MFERPFPQNLAKAALPKDSRQIESPLWLEELARDEAKC